MKCLIVKINVNCFYRQQIDDLENERKRLKEVITKKEENEKKYQGKKVTAFFLYTYDTSLTESMNQLNSITEQQAKDLMQLKVNRLVIHICISSLARERRSPRKS